MSGARKRVWGDGESEEGALGWDERDLTDSEPEHTDVPFDDPESYFDDPYAELDDDYDDEEPEEHPLHDRQARRRRRYRGRDN